MTTWVGPFLILRKSNKKEPSFISPLHSFIKKDLRYFQNILNRKLETKYRQNTTRYIHWILYLVFLGMGTVPMPTRPNNSADVSASFRYHSLYVRAKTTEPSVPSSLSGLSIALCLSDTNIAKQQKHDGLQQE